jgi:hypothetical protein
MRRPTVTPSRAAVNHGVDRLEGRLCDDQDRVDDAAVVHDSDRARDVVHDSDRARDDDTAVVHDSDRAIATTRTRTVRLRVEAVT